MDRRRLLRRVAAAGAAASLAGCTDDSGSGNGDGNGMGNGNGDDGNGDAETPTETDEATPTATETAEPTPTPPTDPDQRVAVGDGLSFDPESFEISVGDTVLWEWVGGGHNIKYDDGSVPDGTDWTGTEGSRTTTYGEGHVHAFTFETAGQYDYYCVPHQSAGMRGSFTVTE